MTLQSLPLRDVLAELARELDQQTAETVRIIEVVRRRCEMSPDFRERDGVELQALYQRQLEKESAQAQAVHACLEMLNLYA